MGEKYGGGGVAKKTVHGYSVPTWERFLPFPKSDGGSATMCFLPLNFHCLTSTGEVSHDERKSPIVGDNVPNQ